METRFFYHIVMMPCRTEMIPCHIEMIPCRIELIPCHIEMILCRIAMPSRPVAGVAVGVVAEVDVGARGVGAPPVAGCCAASVEHRAVLLRKEGKLSHK